MLHRTWGRALAVAAILCAPMLAGDYDHLFDVVHETWPERTLAMAFCDKDLNQMTLIELADTAKAHDISLLIVDLREEKEYNKTVASALNRNPSFVLIIDDDALLGAKSRLTSRLIYRLSGKDIPSVGISKEIIKLGGTLAVGPNATDPIYGAKELARKMKVELPAKAVEPSAK